MEEKKIRSRTTSSQTGARRVRSRSLAQERPVRRRAQSKRRRQRNLMIKIMLFIFIVMAAIAGTVLWMKYSPSKDKADLKEYYGIENEEQVELVLEDESKLKIVYGSSEVFLSVLSASFISFFSDLPFLSIS